MQPDDKTEKTVKSVERTFDIIHKLREGGPMTHSEIAEALEMSSSTAHLHLTTLMQTGYAVHGHSGYALSLRFLRDGYVVRNRNRLYQTAVEEIDKLAQTTGEVANLGIEENGQRVLLYQSEGDEAVYDNALTGEYTNMHWTALGKAILAQLPESRVDEIVDLHGLPEGTEQTISTREELRESLAQIRDQGYALEDEERREGIRSLAVPILVNEEVVGSISVSGPVNRLTDDRIESDLVVQIQDTVNIIQVKHIYD